jgi:hypothetical protein
MLLRDKLVTAALKKSAIYSNQGNIRRIKKITTMFCPELSLCDYKLLLNMVCTNTGVQSDSEIACLSPRDHCTSLKSTGFFEVKL